MRSTLSLKVTGSRLTLLLATTLLALSGPGCGLFNDDELLITIETSKTVTSPLSPLDFSVTARNLGSEQVCWDRGSSSCQLDAVVEVNSKILRAAIPRGCTSDLAPRCLDPGQQRTESFPWEGSVLTGPDQRFTPLAPKLYRVRGAAGNAAFSSPKWIRVE